MNFRQRIVFVNERDPVAILLEDFRKQHAVHLGAERAFEVVEIDHHNLRRLGSARGPAADVDLAHHFGKRILGQVEPGDAQHGRAVLG
jgi:hypothetical protein